MSSGKQSKTSVASSDAAGRKAARESAMTIVTTAVCEPCQTKCVPGIKYLARATAAKATGNGFYGKGVACHLGKKAANV